MIDIQPAAERMIGVLWSVDDRQLDLPTPCPDASVGDLIDHVGVFALVFCEAAHKSTGPRSEAPPKPSRSNLEDGWRERITADLHALAEAWQDPAAWEGFSRAGGIDLPADVVGLVALDELLVHGWDIARATGQPYDAATDEATAAGDWVRSFDAPRDGELFGPVVAVADDATPFEQLLGLTGRDPAWQSAA